MIYPTGQQGIVSFFKTQVKNSRLGHAYLLCGEKGIGKKTLCNYLLNIIMCHTHSACGSCNGCTTVESKANPDIVYVANNNKLSIGVDDVRGITAEAYTRPLISRKKIIVIQNAHLMTAEAQNALLKVIEEPPVYVVFFLLCDSVTSILPTIISRVTKIEIPPLDKQELKKIVPDCPEFMYRYCSGNPGKLIELKNDNAFSEIRNEACKVLMSFTCDDDFEMYSFENLFARETAQIAEIYDILLMLVRDCLLIKNGVGELIVNSDKIEDIKAFCANVSTKKCAALADIIIKARTEIGSNQSTNMSWQTMFIKCREVIHG